MEGNFTLPLALSFLLKLNSLNFYFNQLKIWQYFVFIKGFGLTDTMSLWIPHHWRCLSTLQISYGIMCLTLSALQPASKASWSTIRLSFLLQSLPMQVVRISQKWWVPSWKKPSLADSSLRKDSSLFGILVHLVFIPSTISWCLQKYNFVIYLLFFPSFHSRNKDLPLYTTSYLEDKLLLLFFIMINYLESFL